MYTGFQGIFAVQRGVTIRTVLWVLVVLGLLGVGIYWKLGEVSQSTAVPMMRSELRSLASVQEEYYSQHNRYGTPQDLTTQGYKLPPAMSVDSLELTANGWNIIVVHQNTEVRCQGLHTSGTGLNVQCFQPGQQPASTTSAQGDGNTASAPTTWPDPKPVFSYEPARPQTGQVVSFDASASLEAGGPIEKWVWDMGNDVFLRGQQVQTVYDAPGRYKVSLFVTGKNGKTRQKSQQISIQPDS